MIAIQPLAAQAAGAFPSAPSTLEAAGLSTDLITPLLLKALHFIGEMPGTALARQVGLRYSAIEPLLQQLKLTHLVEIAGGGLTGGPAFMYRLTDAGRARAMLFLEQSQYVGVAPVPLADYNAYMQQFVATMPRTATRERVRRAFRHLVLSDRVLDQLGPAVNGGHSIFIYGPPGNGKTVISQALRELLDGELLIPHAIVSDGHIIKVFDVETHERVSRAPHAAGIVVDDYEFDARWVRCRRPLITIGGELELSQFDLSFEPLSKVYQAPLQLTANGGLLIVDDFGRQTCSPAAMLNRWITPLESRVDYLTLLTGQKVTVAFAVLVVFATNLRPSELLDEAFLRRIHYKVFAENPTLVDFKNIFRRRCDELGLEFEETLVDGIVRDVFRARGIALRATHPRDLIDHALALASYASLERRLTAPLLQSACDSYFVNDPGPDGAAAWDR